MSDVVFADVVFIESPYGGDVDRNLEYARRAMLDSLNRGEAPILAHLLWPQVWDDTDPPIRAAALDRCRDVRLRCDAVIFYVDLGWSEGMLRARAEAVADGQEIEQRRIYSAFGPRRHPADVPPPAVEFRKSNMP